MQFNDVITDPVQFRELIGEPPPPCVAKTIAVLDRHCRAYIAKSPFLLIASSNARGHMDISPKGDPQGFVRILDDSTLAIPDRPGNRRADTYTNVLENPKVGLIFLMPGKTETLRVSGTARIVRDPELLESMAVHGKTPAFALVVEVQEAFFHCSKCIIRSSLWTPSEWPDLAGLPSLAQTMVDAAKLPMPVEEIDQLIKKDEAEGLY
ncbi:MAG: pyridoxamine 5'-phosphate oxidase family protein [Bryobacteraceae bacterium]